MCRFVRCKNCQLFKNSRDLLFEKCTVHYIVNFVHDLFHVSSYSVLRYSDLKPISHEVKGKICFLLSLNNNNNNNNNNDNNYKIKYIVNNRKRYFWKK